MKFEIPVVYSMYGKYYIEANTLPEAKEMVFSPEVGLPIDSSYIEDSLEIDEEGLIEYLKSYFNEDSRDVAILKSLVSGDSNTKMPKK